MKEILIQDNEKNKRLKAFLMDEMSFSGRLVKRLFSEGLVKIDGKKGYGDSKVKKGMTIEIMDFEKTKMSDILPEDLGLEILEQTETFLVIEKPSGMVMNTSENIVSGTLANGVMFLFEKLGITSPVRFLNRLDRDTSGLVIIPLTGHSHSLLQEAYEKGEKLYYAIVSNSPETSEGEIDAPLMKDYEKKGAIKISSIGVKAITEYKVVERLGNFTLMELCLITGRTHQIRAHMKHIGCPIVGDALYGGVTDIFSRQALHAYKIGFKNPENDEWVEFESDIPDDMVKLLDELRMGE